MSVAACSNAFKPMPKHWSVEPRVWGAALLAGTLLLAGCGENPDRPGAPAASNLPTNRSGNVAAPHLTDSDVLIREKGKAVVAEAFSLLSSNLLAALAAGGPSNAIPFCSVQALPLTETVSQTYEVGVRRVSHRVRNPQNAPDAREAAVLDRFEAQVADGQTPGPVVERADGEAFFYAPITISTPLCLTCHGEVGGGIAPETATLLTRLYPEDRATGFKLGDLRGMWVVHIREDAPGP